MRLILFFIVLSFAAKAQIDSAMGVPLVGISFAGQVPGKDMAARFGPNLSVGGMFAYKTKKNWLFGITSNYLFGKTVREDVLAQLRTPEGTITDNEGFPADIRVTERGITIHANFGKVFSVGNANPNSGIMIMLGMGYMQHRVKLYDAQQKVAAIKGDLVKGYDRLSGGFSTSQFIGYLHLAENRLLNFYAGLEFYQGFTHSLRGYSYSTGQPDTEQRLDLLTGVRFGWILPLYERKPNEYYNY